MRRTLLVFVLLVAAALVAEPVIHTHPLTENTSAQCAVCVNAHARVTTLAPAAISPLIIVGEVAALQLPEQPAPAVRALASRAPPAA